MARNPRPDRRPLLYGAAALLILIVAAFLFWPRGGGEDENAYTFLPPETGVGEAEADSVRLSGDLLDAQDPLASSGAAGETTTAPEEMPAEPFTDVKKPVTAQEKMPEPAPARTTRAPESGSRPRSSSELVQPGSTGSYFLYVGSFSSRANAQRRVDALEAAGVPATVAQGEADGQTVYRARVGWFEGFSAAKAYGEDIKRRLGHDFWVAER